MLTYVPSAALVVATFDATAQQADVALRTLYTVPSNGGGTYRLQMYSVVTQAATVSSQLGSNRVTWMDADTGVSENQVALTGSIGSNIVGATAQNQGGNFGIIVIQVQAGSIIQIETLSYASSGATPMQFALHVKLEYLGA